MMNRLLKSSFNNSLQFVASILWKGNFSDTYFRPQYTQGFAQPLTETIIRDRNKKQRAVERGWCVRVTTLPPSVRLLYSECGIRNITRRYRLPRALMGRASYIPEH
jgi:hypothetical protein